MPHCLSGSDCFIYFATLWGGQKLRGITAQECFKEVLGGGEMDRIHGRQGQGRNCIDKDSAGEWTRSEKELHGRRAGDKNRTRKEKRHLEVHQ